MLKELEENPQDCQEFSYETACSGNYDVLDFSSFHLQDGLFPISDENEILTRMHFREFKSEGDSPNICQKTPVSPFNPFIEQDFIPDFDGYFNSGVMTDEYSMGEPFSEIPPPHDFAASTFPSYQLNDLKIRYTKQYLLNCRKSPLSRAFPECLLKYAGMNELPLKQKKQEVRGDYRNMDHILFYNSLPFSRSKYPFGNCLCKHLSI